MPGRLHFVQVLIPYSVFPGVFVCLQKCNHNAEKRFSSFGVHSPPRFSEIHSPLLRSEANIFAHRPKQCPVPYVHCVVLFFLI